MQGQWPEAVTDYYLPWPGAGQNQGKERQGSQALHVSIRDGESQEGLLARFQALVRRSGILNEVKSHRYFISKSEKARIADRKAARRRP